jgi:hypothetical protein
MRPSCELVSEHDFVGNKAYSFLLTHGRPFKKYQTATRHSHTGNAQEVLGLAKLIVLAPLLAAGATERQFDTGGSQRRVA